MNNTGTVAGIVLVVVLIVLLLGGAGMMGFGMTLVPHAQLPCNARRAVPGSAGVGPGMMGGYGMMGGFGAQGFAFNPFGAILSLAFWALIIAGTVILVVWLFRNAGRTGLSASSSDPASELLKTRYAKGEITKEQFEEMRRTLAS